MHTRTHRDQKNPPTAWGAVVMSDYLPPPRGIDTHARAHREIEEGGREGRERGTVLAPAFTLTG